MKLCANSLLVALVLVACGENARAVDRRIEEAQFVRVGGIDQWITIRGDRRSNPVLLLVHGGPGDVQSVLPKVYAPYERDFVLVQWDQRGAGKTFAPNRDIVKELTLERMAQDGIELAEYLCARFDQKKIVVLGHSWGSTLATEMVKRNPKLFSAYVGTGQVSSWRAAAMAQWAHLRSAAQASNDQSTLELMNKIGEPDPVNARQYFSWRPIMNRKYLGAADTAWLAELRALASSAAFDPEELKSLTDGGNFSGSQLLKVMMATDLGASANEMPVPFFVIQGREDFYTPTEPAIEYFNAVKAPKKELTVIEGAGHFALVTHREEFLQALNKIGVTKKPR